MSHEIHRLDPTHRNLWLSLHPPKGKSPIKEDFRHNHK